MHAHDFAKMIGVLFSTGEISCMMCLEKSEKWEDLGKNDQPLYEKDVQDRSKVYTCDTCGGRL